MGDLFMEFSGKRGEVFKVGFYVLFQRVILQMGFSGSGGKLFKRILCLATMGDITNCFFKLREIGGALLPSSLEKEKVWCLFSQCE